jgi:hypothetical protein
MTTNRINKNILESINTNVNQFVINSVIKNAASCMSSSSSYTEFIIGNVEMGGKDNTISASMESVQDIEVTLKCLQQSVQQTDMGKDIALSLLENLLKLIDPEILRKQISASEIKNKDIFNSSSNSVKTLGFVNIKDYQENDTSRKLENLVVNTVSNNINIPNIQNCFLNTSLSISNKIGDIKVLGEENIINIKLSSRQISKSFATCRQLTEQTSSLVTQIVSNLGLEITDTTTNTTISDVTIKESSQTITPFTSGNSTSEYVTYTFILLSCLIIIIFSIVFISKRSKKKSSKLSSKKSNKVSNNKVNKNSRKIK